MPSQASQVATIVVIDTSGFTAVSVRGSRGAANELLNRYEEQENAANTFILLIVGACSFASACVD